jgi:hypothetical protein
MHITIPSYVGAVMDALEAAGHRGYLVGGSLRDLLRGVTPNDYDLTTDATPDEICDRILASADMWCIDNSYKGCFICPTRLNYPIDDLDMEKISEYSRCIELGKVVPRIKVFEYDGSFYVQENAEVAVAYSLCAETFVPCELVKGEPDGREFVRMKDSL